MRSRRDDAGRRREEARRLRFLRRGADRRPTRLRRGVSLLPSLFTMGNLFCGYACVVYAMRGDCETGAMFIGVAIVLDMLDGRIARLTGTSSDFGLQFDSLADVISFGMAPAILFFQWALSSLGRPGWAVGFFFVAAAALRLSRFNIQSAGGGDKRFFVGMPSPPAAGILAATVYLQPAGVTDYRAALLVLPIVLVPAILMVSTVRFRSFKTIDLQVRRPYTVLILIAGAIMLIATHPKIVLVVLAYGYLASAFIEMAITRFRHRGVHADVDKANQPAPTAIRDTAAR